MRAFLPVKYCVLRGSSSGSRLSMKSSVSGDSASMRSSSRSYWSSSASGVIFEKIRSLTPALRKIARGRPCRIGSMRAAMPATQSPPMPRLRMRASWKYSAQEPRSVRLFPSMTMFSGPTGTPSWMSRLEK